MAGGKPDNNIATCHILPDSIVLEKASKAMAVGKIDNNIVTSNILPATVLPSQPHQPLFCCKDFKGCTKAKSEKSAEASTFLWGAR